MSYQVCVRKQGDKFIVGIDAEGAYQAAADTPLQALRKWIHYFDAGIIKYQNQEITLARLAQRTGVSEAEVLEIAEIETLLPSESAISSVKYSVVDKN